MSLTGIKAAEAFVAIKTDQRQLIAGLKTSEAKIKAWGARVGNLGKMMMANGTAIAAPFALSAKIFMDFDDQMRAVQGVTQSTASELLSMTERAKELGRTTSFTAAQVASGMGELGRIGFKSGQINVAIADVMNLSRATGTDLALATEIAGNVMNGFSLDAGKMGHIADVLTATANASAVSVEDLGESFKFAAPMAAAVGMSLEDTAKYLGLLGNFGIKGSEAGNSIKSVQTRLADSKIQKFLKTKLNIDTTDAEGNLRNLADVMADLSKATEGLGSADRLQIYTKVFGKQYIASGAKLATASADSLAAAIDRCDQVANRTAKTMDSGLGGSFRSMQSAVEGAAIAVGDAVAPIGSQLANTVTNIAGAFSNFTAQNPALARSLAGVASSAIAVGGAFYAASRAANVMAGPLSKLMSSGKMLFDFKKASVDATMYQSKLMALTVAEKAGTVVKYAAIAAEKAAVVVRPIYAAVTDSAARKIALLTVAEKAGTALKYSIIAVEKTIAAVRTVYAAITDRTARKIAMLTVAERAGNLLKNATIAFEKRLTASKISLMAVTEATTMKTKMAAIANIALKASISAVSAASAKGGTALQGLKNIGKFLWQNKASIAIAAAGAAMAGFAYQAYKSQQYVKGLGEQIDKVGGSLDKKNQDRQLDKKKFERLEQLSGNKGPLNQADAKEAEKMLGELQKKYGDIGMKFSNGTLTKSDDAKDKFGKAVKKKTMQEINKEALELNTLIQKLQGVKDGRVGAASLAGATWESLLNQFAGGNLEGDLSNIDQLIANAQEHFGKLNAQAALIGRGVEGAEYGGTEEEAIDARMAKTNESLNVPDVAEPAASVKLDKSALQDIADFQSKIADERKTDIQREIDAIDSETQAYQRLLQSVIDYENARPEGERNATRVAEMQSAMAASNQEAERRKQSIFQREAEANPAPTALQMKKLLLQERLLQQQESGNTAGAKRTEAELAKLERDAALENIAAQKTALQRALRDVERATASGDRVTLASARQRAGSAASAYQSALESAPALEHLSKTIGSQSASSRGTFSAWEAVSGGKADWQKNMADRIFGKLKELVDKTPGLEYV